MCLCESECLCLPVKACPDCLLCAPLPVVFCYNFPPWEHPEFSSESEGHHMYTCLICAVVSGQPCGFDIKHVFKLRKLVSELVSSLFLFFCVSLLGCASLSGAQWMRKVFTTPSMS